MTDNAESKNPPDGSPHRVIIEIDEKGMVTLGANFNYNPKILWMMEIAKRSMMLQAEQGSISNEKKIRP